MTDQNPEVPEDVLEAADEARTTDPVEMPAAEPVEDVAEPQAVESDDASGLAPETDEAVIEAEIVTTAEEPVAAEADVVEAEVVDLDLGDEAAPVPTGTDFDVVESPHPAEPAPSSEFEVTDPPAATPAVPAEREEPAAPMAPEPPVPTPPTGGSFLDLPPLPDLPFQAPTPPPASPYPPPAPSYPQASDYPRAGYPSYQREYGEQVAGQAYGHGSAPTAQPQPAPAAPVSPYGTPTGFAVQPYQQVAPGGDVTMASLAHWGALVATVVSGTSLGFLVPLILMLTKGQTDPLVRANAVESLNFNLTVLLGMIASVLLLLAFVGIVGLIVIPIVAVILQILGAIAASRGEVYRYPISIRFVK
jgi:uncharacterized Tic20 family protein